MTIAYTDKFAIIHNYITAYAAFRKYNKHVDECKGTFKMNSYACMTKYFH